ncbi:hypothetical protein EL22_26075 [Halostagnicola sp. A56]|nr:hypothetical protein EL22_26075 [Halostagnicola sp. A56]
MLADTTLQFINLSSRLQRSCTEEHISDDVSSERHDPNRLIAQLRSAISSEAATTGQGGEDVSANRLWMEPRSTEPEIAGGGDGSDNSDVNDHSSSE